MDNKKKEEFIKVLKIIKWRISKTVFTLKIIKKKLNNKIICKMVGALKKKLKLKLYTKKIKIKKKKKI
jgi:hypothetical protein